MSHPADSDQGWIFLLIFIVLLSSLKPPQEMLQIAHVLLISHT